MARQQARRHHRERLAGITLAVLGAVVLVVALFALRDPNGHGNAAAPGQTARVGTVTRSPSTSHPSTTPAPPSSPSSSLSLGSSTRPASSASTDAVHAVPFIVLNNTSTNGLGTQAANRFEAGGWAVTHVDNYRNDIVSTCAYYDPSDPLAKPAAEALQQQYPTIKRVQPKFPELPSGPVVVVLTPDYSAG